MKPQLQMVTMYDFRPCRVTFTNVNRRGSEISVHEGLFHAWTHEAWRTAGITSPHMQMSETYALVELSDGKMVMCRPHEIQFLDGRVNEYYKEHGVEESPQ